VRVSPILLVLEMLCGFVRLAEMFDIASRDGVMSWCTGSALLMN
jgi:hypothetical protein